MPGKVRTLGIAMIRLDAASFLLQWATGGLFFTWVTTRRREVGLGYCGSSAAVRPMVVHVGPLPTAALLGEPSLQRDAPLAHRRVASGASLLLWSVRIINTSSPSGIYGNVGQTPSRTPPGASRARPRSRRTSAPR
jgi:hypothetical protein